MEKENKFTPGPWKVKILDNMIYVNPKRDNGEYAIIAKFGGSLPKPESIFAKHFANATLAASAPDLLAACEAAAVDLKEYACALPVFHDGSTLQLVLKAIAKAKGE